MTKYGEKHVPVYGEVLPGDMILDSYENNVMMIINVESQGKTLIGDYYYDLLELTCYSNGEIFSERWFKDTFVIGELLRLDDV